MLNEPTMDKLQALRLSAMAEAWVQQAKDPKLAELSFDERFGMLVDAEYLARDNRRMSRLLKDAQLRIAQACIEDVETSAARGIDKAMLRQLGTGGWVREHQSILISGPTGVGKSYLGCALAQAACRKRHRVLYRRIPRLLDELALAHAEGTFAKTLARLAKFEVLMLDDWGIGTLKEPQRQDLLEVIEDRYGTVSTIVTSQLPVSKWHEWIGDPTMADAILDRLVHNAYKIELKGHTRRRDKTTTSE